MQAYPEVADLLSSRYYKWGGDARGFDRDDPFIELITTPNNPDGVIREPVVNKPKGSVVYDLAYYWPHFTAITSAANHHLMLFTFSKCTGHAGSRIGYVYIVCNKSSVLICSNCTLTITYSICNL